MNPNKILWEKGDFTQIAATMRESGELLVARLGIKKDMYVLDLGCGDGTTAIPAARTGAQVLGVDIADNLVAAGNVRAKAAGLTNCVFQEGDATNLHLLETHAFDRVISIFGAMFAPMPLEVAKEMVRVTRPGGKIYMGNWIPGDPTLVARILKISSAYTPAPPEGFVSPMRWGVQDEVTSRFVNAGIPSENIHFSIQPFTFKAPYSPAAFVNIFRLFYGPTMNAFEAAAKNGLADELQRELEELFTVQNSHINLTTTSITANYLLVEVGL